MECFRCQRGVTQQQMPDGSVVFYCEHCGWGKERLAAARQAGSADETPHGPSAAMQLLRLTV